jgi:ATP-dependent helicase/nuclease subunit B
VKITFGMSLDGIRWSAATAAVGEVRLGPQGFMSLLETRLGLTAPEVHPVRRINEYQQRLQKLNAPDAWFHESFQADAWSTARQLLAWRDELIEAGWDGHASSTDSSRLQALASVEHSVSLPLSPGRSDRLQAVARSLALATSLSLTEVVLVERLVDLPPIWQQVLARLQKIGVRVVTAPKQAVEKPHHNLSIIQSVMAGSKFGKRSLTDDESLLRLTAANEWEAAQAVALWLSASSLGRQSVSIVCDHKTDLLDQALAALGLPQLGVCDASQWRSVLQVLPLVVANAWSPVDVEHLVELLQLPVSPIPRYAAREFLSAMSEEPGTGGREWAAALKRIECRYQEKQAENGKVVSTAQAMKLASELDYFLAKDRHDPRIGITEQALKARCQWVIDALSWRMEEDPLIMEAVSHARELYALAKGKKMLPRVMVERMLDSIIGMGTTAPSRIAEAAPWQSVTQPGHLIDPVDVVIWWGFNNKGIQRYSHWTASEYVSVAKRGGHVEPASSRRRREADDWRRPLVQAREHCMLVSLCASEGEVLHTHPVWDDVVDAVTHLAGDTGQPSDELFRREASSLFEKASWQLAGRKGKLEKVAVEKIAIPQSIKSIPPKSVDSPEKQSFSAMNTMIACPMQWVLSRHAKLYASRSAHLPTGNQMLGTLCHRIVEEMYSAPAKKWKPEKARKEAERLFDELLPSMAAELLMEGQTVQRQRAKKGISDGVTALVERISLLGLSVSAVEAKLQATFEGKAEFNGTIDLQLVDKAGQHYLLDLKWTGSSQYKQAEVENGEALQLASYAWLLSNEYPKKSVKTGYFMLAQGELFSASESLAESRQALAYRQDKAVWDAGIDTWRSRLQSIKAGKLEATGLTELIALNDGQKKYREEEREKAKEKGQLYVAPSCNSCDYATLCGLKEGTK